MPSSRRPREGGSRYHRRMPGPREKMPGRGEPFLRSRTLTGVVHLPPQLPSLATPGAQSMVPGPSPPSLLANAPGARAPLGAWERGRGSWTRRGGLGTQHCRLGGGQRRGAPPPCPACGPSRGGGRRRRPARQAARGDRPGGAIPCGGTSPWVTRGAGGGEGRGADAEGRNNLKAQRVVLLHSFLLPSPLLNLVFSTPFQFPTTLLCTPLRLFSLLSFTLLPFLPPYLPPSPLTLSSPHLPPSISSLSPLTPIHPSTYLSIHPPPPLFLSPWSAFSSHLSFPLTPPFPSLGSPWDRTTPTSENWRKKAQRSHPQITQSGPGAGVFPRLKSTPGSQQHLPLKHLSRRRGADPSHTNLASSEQFQMAPGSCLLPLSHRTASSSMKLTVMLCLGTSPGKQW